MPSSPTDTLLAVVALLDGVPAAYADLDDAALLETQDALGRLSRVVARHGVAVAGEVVRRSAPERGSQGLAQTTGHRTPVALIQVATGLSAPEAAQLFAVGSLPAESPLAVGVAAGEIAVSAADAIRRGLGRPDAGTSAETLDAVAADLVSRAPGFTPEQLYRAAADARNRIDVEGVARREKERRDARYLRVKQREDGTRQPAVHVLVTAHELASGLGFAHLEDAPEAVSIATARRIACANGLIGVLFTPAGQPLDVGRAQRTFTERQRIALAARDGGCRFPGCTRPPSYCEAHHIDHWLRDHGSTDVSRGILLCKHHHMLTHNNEWEIIHDPDVGYAIVPPPTIDPHQKPRPMPTKNPIMRRLAMH